MSKLKFETKPEPASKNPAQPAWANKTEFVVKVANALHFKINTVTATCRHIQHKNEMSLPSEPESSGCLQLKPRSMCHTHTPSYV